LLLYIATWIDFVPQRLLSGDFSCLLHISFSSSSVHRATSPNVASGRYAGKRHRISDLGDTNPRQGHRKVLCCIQLTLSVDTLLPHPKAEPILLSQISRLRRTKKKPPINNANHDCNACDGRWNITRDDRPSLESNGLMHEHEVERRNGSANKAHLSCSENHHQHAHNQSENHTPSTPPTRQ
jgi:hypothetical protein